MKKADSLVKISLLLEEDTKAWEKEEHNK